MFHQHFAHAVAHFGIETDNRMVHSQHGGTWHMRIYTDQTHGIEHVTLSKGDLSTDAPGPVIASHSWVEADDCCMVSDNELVHVGVVYVESATPPDWFLGRQDSPEGSGLGFVNMSGTHGDWVDLETMGFGNRWAIENVINDACGPVPVESGSWGAVKHLYR